MQAAFDSVNFKKAIGPDWASGQYLTHDSRKLEVTSQLSSMLNNCVFPKYMSEGRLVLLSKTQSEYPGVDETRPLLIESHLTKIIERIILNKLKDMNSDLFKVGCYQKGFKAGESTYSNIVKMLETILP